jgi:ADP-ribose pyrophosphatase YjhB (NUDIX family)
MQNEDRFKMFAATYLVLIKNGQVLLHKRNENSYQGGNYGLVSGHFDGDETTKDCIIREVLEEADITINPEDLKIVHVMHRKASDREYFDVFVMAEKWTGEILNMEPNKCDSLDWYRLNELPENMVPEVKFALESFQKGLFYSDFGWPQQ